VWRAPLHLAALKDDPLPQIDAELPVVYFPDDAPSEDRSGIKRPLVDSMPIPPYVKEVWTFSHGIPHLPVKNSLPFVVDVVVNFSPGDFMGSEGSDRAYHANATLMLQIASVLAGLSPAIGCIRISAVDALRQTMLLDRASPDFDWMDFRETVN